MIGANKETAHVRLDTVADFSRGTDIVAVVLYDYDTIEKKTDTIKAAQLFLETLPHQNLYNIVSFNCETFALLCRVGPEMCVVLSQSFSMISVIVPQPSM